MTLLNLNSDGKFNNKKLRTIFAVGALVGVVAFGATYASGIGINGDAAVEFGQGFLEKTACDDSITVTPTTDFANSADGGTFALSTIAVSDIDSASDHCYGKTFSIKGFGTSGGALSLVSGVTSVEVIDQGTTFVLASEKTGVSITSSDGTGFTLTFDSASTPVSAASLAHITIESSAVGAFVVSGISGTILSRVTATETYTVSTFSVANGVTPVVTWYTTGAGTTSTTAPTGISITPSAVTSGSSTLTVTAGSTTSAGSYFFKVAIGNSFSSVTTLEIGAGPMIVGDTGPGGGIVFYANSAGFPCGPTFSNDGSPTGGLCHYLEVAPKSWSGGSLDNKYPWLSSSAYACDSLTVPTACSVANNNVYDVTGITNIPYPDWTNTLAESQIGLGYRNSLAIVGAPNTNSTITAAAAARAYSGGSKSDWYLPTVAEYNQMCKWGYGLQTNTAAYDLCDYNIGTSILTGTLANFTFNWNGQYWSSSESSAVTSIRFNLTRQYAGDGSTPSGQEKGVNQKTAQGWHNFVRPIRAF